MISAIGMALFRRGDDGSNPHGGGGSDAPQYEMPAWGFLVIILNFVILLPFVIILNYTLKQLYPVFAMIEDENPPAYEPLSLNDPAASSPDGVPHLLNSKPTDGRPQTVTSSVRAVNRLLRANGGFWANFRGLSVYLIQAVVSGLVMGFFSAWLSPLSSPVASLLASLVVIQIGTAWVHVVISQPSNASLWSRLPNYKRTFEATWRPVTMYWAAWELSRWTPFAVAAMVDLKIPQVNLTTPTSVEEPMDASSAWKGLLVIFVTAAVSLCLVFPAHVILVRVQASLLPEEETTIIPFDRSFQGKIQPAVAGGRGYATVSDAWSTFSRTAWRRLLFLYVKVYLIADFGAFVMAAVVMPQVFMLAKSVGNGDGDDL